MAIDVRQLHMVALSVAIPPPGPLPSEGPSPIVADSQNEGMFRCMVVGEDGERRQVLRGRHNARTLQIKDFSDDRRDLDPDRFDFAVR